MLPFSSRPTPSWSSPIRFLSRPTLSKTIAKFLDTSSYVYAETAPNCPVKNVAGDAVPKSGKNSKTVFGLLLVEEPPSVSTVT